MRHYSARVLFARIETKSAHGAKYGLQDEGLGRILLALGPARVNMFQCGTRGPPRCHVLRIARLAIAGFQAANHIAERTNSPITGGRRDSVNLPG